MLNTHHAGTYNSESAAWLRWRKTRAEVFGHDVAPWAESWALHLISTRDGLRAQNYLWQHLQNGVHYQHGQGYQRIPSEWKQKKCAAGRWSSKQRKCSMTPNLSSIAHMPERNSAGVLHGGVPELHVIAPRQHLRAGSKSGTPPASVGRVLRLQVAPNESAGQVHGDIPEHTGHG